MSTSSGTGGADDQGGRVVEELRLLVDALLGSSMGDLQARAQRWHAESDREPHVPTTCGWCPLCAVIAVVRGQRPEVAVRLAECVAGLIQVLRDVVEQHDAPRHHYHGASNGRAHNGADHDGRGGDDHRGDDHSHTAASQVSGGESGSGPAAEEPLRTPSRVQRINLRRTEGCSSDPSIGTEGCSSDPSIGTEGRLSGEVSDAGGGEPMC